MTLRQLMCEYPFGRSEAKSAHSSITTSDVVCLVLHRDFFKLYCLPLTAIITPPATIRLPPRKMGSVGT